MTIDEQLFRLAVEDTMKGHSKQRQVVRFKTDLETNIMQMYRALHDGSWRTLIEYREGDVTNNNGKHRHVFEPSFKTRALQHYWLLLVTPLYDEANRTVGMARNCLPDHGITAKRKDCGVLHETKHLFYDLRQYHYVLVMDQRQCYAHVTVKTYRRAMKYLFQRLDMPIDKELIDFGEAVGFAPDGTLPIGTPTSPYIHHIVMLRSDVFIRENTEWALRYADDNIMAFRDARELNAMKWRVQWLWWYCYGIRAKRSGTMVVCIDKAGLDFCSYIPHRMPPKSEAGSGSMPHAALPNPLPHPLSTMHGKGYTTVRRQTVRKALKCGEKAWPSYFGILKEADRFAVMVKIQARMKAQDLVSKVRIDRDMDAPHIDMKDLAGVAHNVYDFKLLKDSKGKPNWVKAIIGIPEYDNETGPATGREIAREYHGSLQGIVDWLAALEKAFGGRSFLPIEDGEIVNECGYIYKGSTNQMQYIEK